MEASRRQERSHDIRKAIAGRKHRSRSREGKWDLGDFREGVLPEIEAENGRNGGSKSTVAVEPNLINKLYGTFSQMTLYAILR
jgi:hypothetical protein